MVGLGGSGRRSAVKLAASMADAELIQVEVGKTYGFTEWREDMKKLVMKAGINGRTTVFLFCDSQVNNKYKVFRGPVEGNGSKVRGIMT